MNLQLTELEMPARKELLVGIKGGRGVQQLQGGWVAVAEVVLIGA